MPPFLELMDKAGWVVPWFGECWGLCLALPSCIFWKGLGACRTLSVWGLCVLLSPVSTSGLTVVLERWRLQVAAVNTFRKRISTSGPFIFRAFNCSFAFWPHLPGLNSKLLYSSAKCPCELIPSPFSLPHGKPLSPRPAALLEKQDGAGAVVAIIYFLI